MSILKNINMKDSLQIYLESVCKAQFWAKKQISKNIDVVDKINKNSISSVKQKLK